jgi:sec-independent protein translocase protein TatA
MGGLGTTELLIILGVVLLLFGGAKLPKLARSIGQASSEFKKGVTEGAKDGATETSDATPAANPTTSTTSTNTTNTTNTTNSSS